MSYRNTTTSYGSVAKFYHWTSSTLIIIMLVVGFFMVDLEPPTKFTVYMLHKSTGLVILALLLMRLIWTLSNPKPGLPEGSKLWEKIAVKSMHYILYIVILAMPLSGWIMSSAAGFNPSLYGLFEFPFPGVVKSKALADIMHDVHFILGWTLVALLVLHILAALKHHFINKDNVLTRMMPNKK